MVKKKIKDYEDLIGKEAYGFKFTSVTGPNFVPEMKNYIGKVGTIEDVSKGSLNLLAKLRFDDGEYWHYPASQVKHHLVPPIDINELFNEISKIC